VKPWTLDDERTMSQVDEAGLDIDTEALIELAAPIPHHLVKVRPGGGGKQLRYIEAATVRERLNAVIGPANWSSSIEVHRNCMVCSLTLTLPSGRMISRAGVGGYPDAQNADTGRGLSEEDRPKAAATDALKRAGLEFGIGAELYEDGHHGNRGSQQVGHRQDPARQQQRQDDRRSPPRRPGELPPFRGSNGRALFAWAKENGVIEDINNIGRRADYAPRMVDWSDSQVIAAYGELAGRPAGVDSDDY
jgi:hypothetical protein